MMVIIIIMMMSSRTTMAALRMLKHGVSKFQQFPIIPHIQTYATKAEKRKGIDRKQPPKIDSTIQSIAAKGFLRPQKDYQPPKDIERKLNEIFAQFGGDKSKELTSNEKYNLLMKCATEFNHSVPNSLLYTIQNFDDVRRFYTTPVDTKTPLDRMRNMELPENLHVQFEYHRFHPETDTKFKGITAFNRSSTLVTGLKYKGKYKGHKQEPSWPFNS